MINKILLITDRIELARQQAQTLMCSGIEVSEMDYTVARTKLSGTDLKRYNLILLNMYDNGSNSLKICRELRAEYHNPILFLVCEHNERFLLHAYEAGADDCLIQPLGIHLFEAKVRAWLQRASLKESPIDLLEAYNFSFDPAKGELTTPEAAQFRLSQLEARFLHLLLVNSGHIVATDTIMQRVWPNNNGTCDSDRQLLKALVYRLRRKIERNPHEPQYIHTIAHKGYSFCLN